MVKLYALRCCGGNGIWDIPLSAISHFSLWQIFFGISHFPPISQFQVHSRCGELKLGYPKIPKYGNIVVVAKRKWDIPHIPELPNIPKNNVLPLWQKKIGISRFVCQYPKIITIFDVADFKRDMIMNFFFIIYIIVGLLVRFKIFNINIDPTTQRIQKVENIRVIRLRIY